MTETITAKSARLREWIDWRTRDLFARQAQNHNRLTNPQALVLSWLELRAIARHEWHDANGTYSGRARKDSR